jgi:hypothetical protein
MGPADERLSGPIAPELVERRRCAQPFNPCELRRCEAHARRGGVSSHKELPRGADHHFEELAAIAEFLGQVRGKPAQSKIPAEKPCDRLRKFPEGETRQSNDRRQNHNGIQPPAYFYLRHRNGQEGAGCIEYNKRCNDPNEEGGESLERKRCHCRPPVERPRAE